MRLLVVLFVGFHTFLCSQVEINFVSEKEINGLYVQCHSRVSNITQEYVLPANGQLLLKRNWTIGDSLNLRINNFDDLYLDTSFVLKVSQVISLRSMRNLEETKVYAETDEIPLDKAKNAITVIEKEFIEKTGSQTLTDVLESQPNVSIINDPVLGQSIRLAGQSGENVQILVDGVPVIGRLDGNIDPSQILLNNVEKIEIFVGDLSDIYGNNAQAGTINIITRNTDKNQVSGQLSSYYESSGNYNIDAYLHLSSKKHRFSLAGGRNFFDGWNEGEEYSLLPRARKADAKRVQSWKPKEAYFGDASWSFKSSKIKNTLNLSVYKDEILNRGLPIAPYNIKAKDEKYYTTRLGASNQTIIPLKKGYLQNLISYNFYQRKKLSYLKDLTDLSMSVLPDGVDNNQDTSAVHAQMLRSIYHLDVANLKLKLGIHEYYESYKGNRIINGNQFIISTNAFVNAQYDLKKLNMSVLASMRYGYNSSFNVKPLGKLSLAKSLWKQRIQFILTYSKGFRAPNVKEMYYDFVDINHNIQGNENLESESADNYQFLLKSKLDKKERLSLDANYRFNKIKNQIVLGLLNGTNTYTYLNLDNSKVHSTSFSLLYNYKNWHLRGGASYTHTELTGETNEELTAADIAFSATYEFSKGGWGLTLRSNYVFKQDNLVLDGELMNVSSLSPYLNADIAVNKYFIKRKLMLNIGINNLTNNTQRSINGTTNTGGAHSSNSGSLNLATGRQFFLSIIYKFNKR